MNLKRITDILMTIALMLLMSKQITEQAGHEYTGIIMFTLFLLHQYLNRKWYSSIFKGRYSFVRTFSLVVNLSLLVSFVTTAFSGIIMSENFPSLNVEALTSFAREAHLSCSYLSFVLMGVHLGLHWGMIAGKITSALPGILGSAFAGYGLYVFMSLRLWEYIFLINEFAFIDYDKNPVLVLIENIAMMSFWTLAGYQASRVLAGKILRPLLSIAIAGGVFAVLWVFIGIPEAGW
ncbi:MAG: DUF4405 domain-containing protein [Synergistaceae bacterium]|nr:DUF4405 domain-containing protein [Synergistaceae bacterium]